MNSVSVDIINRLQAQWCDAFSGHHLPDGAITVSTPFLFPDGDGFPVILKQNRNGWLLTDAGITAYQFIGDEFSITSARADEIGRYASAAGFDFDDNILSRRLDRPPTVEDVADMIALVAQVSGLPYATVPRDRAEVFKTRAANRTLKLLARPDLATPNWKPQIERGALFPADLHIEAGHMPAVVAFFATESNKVDRSAATIARYQQANLDVAPIIVHSGQLRSATIHRAQELLGDDSAVVAVEEQSDLGFRQLGQSLQQRGVAVLG